MTKHLLLSGLALVAAMMPLSNARAQAVAFPMEASPGTATSSQSDDGVYILANDLLSVSFTEQDGTLVFSGSDELGLKPGTPLFNVSLATGGKVTSSDMTLNSVVLTDLAADPTSTVASGKLPGKALTANFSYGDLDLEWQAVLRDGSHYIRTVLTLAAKADVAMKSVVPMFYEIDAAAAPEVVGNTRGAVLASETIFAGLETPTGINSVVTSTSASATVTADAGFSFSSWSRDTTGDTQPSNPAYWTWAPGDELPSGIGDLGFASDEVRGKRGFVRFAQAGSHTATFRYSNGTHGLNILGVDLINDKGEVVASDYHIGFTGGVSRDNVYTLGVPEAGDYLVRFFVDIRTETITANGTITWSPSVSAGSSPVSALADAGFSLGSWRADTNDDYYYGVVANPAYWTWAPGAETPSGITALSGVSSSYVRGKRGFMRAAQAGTHTVTFTYTGGSHKLNVVGVDLVNDNGEVVASDYHIGSTGGSHSNNIYTLDIPQAGIYHVRYFIDVRNETVTSTGSITWSPSVESASGFETEPSTPESDVKTYIQGLWSRQTTLAAGKSWTVSAVVGLIAPNQARRSFLAYSERERAVPWRPFPHYNSWYELNIDRNNSATYDGHMTAEDCENVVEQWKTNLFDRYDTSIKAFVWDDGWDQYGTWTFNKGFPNGFKEPYELARDYGVGTGAWLGPVGGYGNSGNLRRQYWQNKGGMQLSNPAYYKVFLDACSDMVDKYDFCFFKLDGISAQFSSVGPDAGAVGEENAEGIIDVLSAVREIRPDMFFNTTVGTWASPFWFHYTDAVWRQEGDHGTVGNQGDDRERWITYRDRLVYQNFVQNSPLCPINTLMTHGVILTEHGDVSKTMDYDGIVREIRCAFACGSGMVELYCDANLLNTINGGALWGDIAECIKWQEKNADVLPDIHWVGGNPWDGSRANVYGWASWNGSKGTLALRNPSASAQSYTFTIREALDIPSHITDPFSFVKSFESQTDLPGLTENRFIDIDAPVTVNIPASSVFIFDGISGSTQGIDDIISDEESSRTQPEDNRVFDLIGREHRADNLAPGIYIKAGKKFIVR